MKKTDLKKELNTAIEMNYYLKNQIANLEFDKSELKNKLNTAKACFKIAVEVPAIHKEENESLFKDIQELNDRIYILGLENAKITLKNQRLASKIANMDAVVAEFNGIVNENERLVGENKKLEKEKTELETEYDKFYSHNAKLVEKIIADGIKINILRGVVEKLKNELQTEDSQIKRIKNKKKTKYIPKQ